MTDHPPNRLWPLALMGWLAAFPPQGQDKSADAPDLPLEQPTPPRPPAPPPAKAPRLRRRKRDA